MAQIIRRSTIDLEAQKKRLMDRMQRNLSRSLQAAARGIVKRTQDGKEIDGGEMAAYTDKYAAWKSGYTTTGKRRRVTKYKAVGDLYVEKKMRVVRSHFGGGKVNLTLSGKMLQSITSDVKIEGNEIVGKIYFSTQDGANKARWNDPKRPFFGLSKEQKAAIFNALKQQ